MCHGDVLLEPGVVDDTKNCLMRGFEVNEANVFGLPKKNPKINDKNSAPGSNSIRATSRFHARHPILRYPHKTHYRIVFEEQGITIDDIRSLPDVLTILAETATALQLLRKLGWVHRDVSIGNILSYEGGTKLADLEYAKKMEDKAGGHNMRTGTLHFMSIEVAAHEFLFEAIQPGETIDPRERKQRNRQLGASNATQDNWPTNISFAYNHLHDLESLWWVAVWIVFYNQFRDPRQPNEEPISDLDEVEDRLQLAQILFPPSMLYISRRDNFQKFFLKVCKELPSNKRTITNDFDVLRRNLIQHYVKVEAKLPQSIDLTASKDDIYEDFKNTFTLSREDYLDVTMTFIPDIHTQLGESSKRRKVESDNDT